MIDGIPVIDAVVHPYNLAKENYRTPHAPWITEMLSRGNAGTSPPGYRMTSADYEREWGMEEVANMSFVESHADLAAYHVVPIRAFHDGICSVEKGLEARERWPDRFLFYVGIDPLEGERALEDLERQVELFGGDAVGLKMYPNSWTADEISGWLMDDPEVAFPVLERALQLGIKTTAIHKALPLGPVELRHYRVDDIDRAAMAFPDMSFEIVHGGMAFLEETAWQLARFDNVWVNLESTATMATRRPKAFEHAMATLIRSPKCLDQIFWGTGCMVAHPRPHLEDFVRRFRFSDELVDGGTVAQITEDDKRKILAGNYARLHGVDLEDRLARVAGDVFDQRRGPDGDVRPPYSTTAISPLPA